MSPVRGITGGDPSFGADDGSADPAVSLALAAYATADGSEHDALAALAASRLLVPVVAVLSDEALAAAPRNSADMVDTASTADMADTTGRAEKAEKASEMALPTLIGLDGRRAIPAFTCVQAMQRWRPDARPVPAAALQVWQAAVDDSCAVVIDVGGPVPLAVEGARLAALARGEGPPVPWADPDVRDAVAAVLAGQLEVAAFELRPADADHDLGIALNLAPDAPVTDVTGFAAQIAGAVLDRLGGRLRRGVAIWLGSGR